MEEVESAKVNKNLKTGHKRSYKFMIFDKQKSSDVKFYGNQNSETYLKKNQNNTSECSSDCIRVIDDSESSISYCESDGELERPLKIKSPARHRYQSNLKSNYNQNRISQKEMHIFREIKAQQLLLQYLKCKNALIIGFMNLTYAIFDDFRVPQSGQHEKAKPVIIVDYKNIACVEDIIQKNIEMIDENPKRNKLSSVDSNNKLLMRSEQYNRKRVKRKAISDIIGSICQKNSMKRSGFELPPRCRNMNPQTNKQTKRMTNGNIRHQSSSGLQCFSQISKLRVRKQKQSFLPNILRLKPRLKQSAKVSSSQISLRNFHKLSRVALKTNAEPGISDKVIIIGKFKSFGFRFKEKLKYNLIVIVDGQLNFPLSTKHNPRLCTLSKDKRQIGRQQLANLRSNSRTSVKSKSRNQLILPNCNSRLTLISAKHANKILKQE